MPHERMRHQKSADDKEYRNAWQGRNHIAERAGRQAQLQPAYRVIMDDLEGRQESQQIEIVQSPGVQHIDPIRLAQTERDSNEIAEFP